MSERYLLTNEENPLLRFHKWALEITEVESHWCTGVLYDISQLHGGKYQPESIARMCVKWDGCSNTEWSAPRQQHHCGGRAWREFGEVLQAVYRILLERVSSNYEAEGETDLLSEESRKWFTADLPEGLA